MPSFLHPKTPVRTNDPRLGNKETLGQNIGAIIGCPLADESVRDPCRPQRSEPDWAIPTWRRPSLRDVSMEIMPLKASRSP